MLLIKLILILISTSFLGCANKDIPQPPPVNIYMHDTDSDSALCSDSNAHTCAAVPIRSTDKWIMFTPQGFQSLENYIDLLVCKLNDACTGMMSAQSTEKKTIKLNEQDLKQARKQIDRIKNTLKRQRSIL